LRGTAQNFLVFWVLNLVVFFVAHWLFREQVVFGNILLPYWAALLVASFLQTGVVFLVKPILVRSGLKLKGDLNWVLIYTVANIVTVWVLARLAFLTGFGISSFIVAIVLGIILIICQWILGKFVTK
jgi:uncharacterized membrane protein YvlD (DUF360 family)